MNRGQIFTDEQGTDLKSVPGGTQAGMTAVTSVVIPGLTRNPVYYHVAGSDSLFHWIPACAGMTDNAGFRHAPE